MMSKFKQSLRPSLGLYWGRFMCDTDEVSFDQCRNWCFCDCVRDRRLFASAFGIIVNPVLALWVFTLQSFNAQCFQLFKL